MNLRLHNRKRIENPITNQVIFKYIENHYFKLQIKGTLNNQSKYIDKDGQVNTLLLFTF